MIGVRYVFYSYSTESGKWKNVTFTPTDSRTGRAIEVKKQKKKQSALSQLAHAWLAVWVVLIFRQGKQDGSNRWISPAPHWPCKSFGEWIFRVCSETGAAEEFCELGIWFSYSKTEQPSHIPVFYHFLNYFISKAIENLYLVSGSLRSSAGVFGYKTSRERVSCSFVFRRESPRRCKDICK